MSRFNGGWIKLYRKAIVEDIGSNGYRLAIWVTLLTWASRFESTIDWGGHPRRIPPGSILFGMMELADHLQFSKKTVHKHLHYLQEKQSILLEVGTRGSLVTICKWKEYQEIEEGVVTPREHEGNAEVTRRERGATLNGEEKKVRKERKKNVGILADYPPEFEEVWKLYGRRGDKKEAGEAFKGLGLVNGNFENLKIAIKNYCIENPDLKWRWHFSKFLKSDWRENLKTPSSENHAPENLFDFLPHNQGPQNEQ